jgi:hypothetical protein
MTTTSSSNSQLLQDILNNVSFEDKYTSLIKIQKLELIETKTKKYYETMNKLNYVILSDNSHDECSVLLVIVNELLGCFILDAEPIDTVVAAAAAAVAVANVLKLNNNNVTVNVATNNAVAAANYAGDRTGAQIYKIAVAAAAAAVAVSKKQQQIISDVTTTAAAAAAAVAISKKQQQIISDVTTGGAIHSYTGGSDNVTVYTLPNTNNFFVNAIMRYVNIKVIESQQEAKFSHATPEMIAVGASIASRYFNAQSGGGGCNKILDINSIINRGGLVTVPKTSAEINKRLDDIAQIFEKTTNGKILKEYVLNSRDILQQILLINHIVSEN